LVGSEGTPAHTRHLRPIGCRAVIVSANDLKQVATKISFILLTTTTTTTTTTTITTTPWP
jgi:ribosomal protein L32E